MKKFLQFLPLLASLSLAADSDHVLFASPEKEIFIEAAGEGTAFRSMKFPALKRNGKETVILVFDNSVHMPQGGGWNGYTQLTLNGKALGRYTDAGDERLLRRGTRLVSTFHKEPTRDWWEGNTLLTLFGPGIGEVGPGIVSPRDQGYTFWIDVTDAIHFVEIGPDNRIESAKENELRIGYTLSEKRFGGRKSRLRVANLRVVAMSASEADRLRPEPPIQPLNALSTVASVEKNNLKLEVTAGGGAIIRKNGEEFHLTAEFSYPAAPDMKYNRLSTGNASGQQGWKPEIVREGDTIKVRAKSPLYRLERTLIHCGHRVEISDALTNETPGAIGVRYVYDVATPGKIVNRRIFMAGTPNATFADGIADNPTLYVEAGKSGIGVMALDDVFRNHLEIVKLGGNRISMYDEHTALPSGGTYVWKSLVYLTGSPDYFVFLNALRRDLGRDQTVIGPFAFDLPKSDKFDLSVMVCGPWFGYTVRGGKLYSGDEYVTRMDLLRREATARRSGLKFLARLETNIVTLEKNKIENGSKLPVSCHLLPDGTRYYGAYGHIANREQTEIVKKNTPLADSLLHTADGRVKLDCYYAAEPRINLLVQVEENNSRYREILDQMRFMKDTVKIDGFYFDQFEAGVTGPITRACRCTYDRWDGRTVDLAKDGSITRKFYDFALTGNTARAKIMRYALDNRLLFVANNQSVSESTANFPAMRFHEFENDPVHDLFDTAGEPPARRILGKCQLSGSPVTLGIRTGSYTKDPMKYGSILNRAVITALRHGVLYYHYDSLLGPNAGPGITNCMYPITPVELGKGFIVGKERVLSAVSGKFITPKKPVAIHRFDKNGNAIPDGFSVRQVPGGWETDIRLRDWEETAALILQQTEP